MSKTATAPASSPQAPTAGSPAAAPATGMITIGKDVLELLSSAMYVDPLSIYREYVQNSADAIEEARSAGLLASDEDGEVQIRIDAEQRKLILRDNGIGIPIDEATERLLAIGASPKRGTRARGFRGVGRLAGLAYARSLTFRTRSSNDREVLELRWDCQRLKAALRDLEQKDDIASVIGKVVSIRRLPTDGFPSHFFEVELADVIRTHRDCLLSAALVRDYLGQVAPVPFAPEFSWGSEITEHLAPVPLGNLDIRFEGDEIPVTRPFDDRLKVSDSLEDTYSELELVTLSDLDGGVAAVGWILHHSYLGSITVRSRIGGLRVRVGNVQVGGEDLLAEIFPETRFNGWAVGELHVLDPRILPNARRDHFEQNVHYSNFTAQLEPLARRIARRARASSIARNQQRRTLASTVSDANVGQPAPSSAANLDASSRKQPSSIEVREAFVAGVRLLAKEAGLSDAEARKALEQF